MKTVIENLLAEYDMSNSAFAKDLREALAEQPAQTDWEAVAADQAMTIALLRAEQLAQQEPWGACVSGRVFVGALPEYVRKLSEDEGLPIQWLYTSPPAQRKPLTDEEIEIRIGYRLPPHGFDAIRQLIKENT